MPDKSLQEQRMRGYFIQAAKEIIRGEGLVCVSTRNVAERAGYSYATLYNYFKDIKDLVFECAVEFLDEARAFVREALGSLPAGEKRLKAVVTAYLNYFIQYPGIFDLLFLEKISRQGNHQQTADLIYGFLDSLIKEDVETLIAAGALSRGKAQALVSRL